MKRYLKKLYKIFAIIVLGWLTTHFAYSQVIQFERTDVDGQNADFITATYSFGIDIRIDSIEFCSNVAFELSHNLVNHVKLSEWYPSEEWLIDNDWSKVATIVHEVPVDSANDRAVIAIEAGMNSPASEISPNNPKIIHLEFVVSPSALHNEVLEFTINRIKATHFKDTIIELTIPTTTTIPYRVHSYINVWPGDANCNGEVRIDDDCGEISKYLTFPNKLARSFRREKANILWQAQSCIAWDTLAATYADCDGNGAVTTSDMGVVRANYYKTHSDICQTAEVPNINPNINIKNTFHSAEALLPVNLLAEESHNMQVIPINICSNISDSLVGVAGIIDYSECPSIELADLTVGEFFGENTLLHFYDNKETKLASFCIFMQPNELSKMNKNTVAYIHFESKDDMFSDIKIKDLVGFDEFGKVLEVTQTPTSIDLKEFTEFYINVDSEYLYLYNIGEEVQSLNIINYLGQSVAEYSPNSEQMYSISNLSTGGYLVIVKTNNKILTKNFIIIKN